MRSSSRRTGASAGVTFTLGGPIDAPDAYVGFDVIVAEDGRIRNVYGFMDAVPAE